MKRILFPFIVLCVSFTINTLNGNFSLKNISNLVLHLKLRDIASGAETYYETLAPYQKVDVNISPVALGTQKLVITVSNGPLIRERENHYLIISNDTDTEFTWQLRDEEYKIATGTLIKPHDNFSAIDLKEFYNDPRNINGSIVMVRSDLYGKI